jgi:hypothetical protein
MVSSTVEELWMFVKAAEMRLLCYFATLTYLVSTDAKDMRQFISKLMVSASMPHTSHNRPICV